MNYGLRTNVDQVPEELELKGVRTLLIVFVILHNITYECLEQYN